MKKEVGFGILIVLAVCGFLYFQVNNFNKNNQVLNQPENKQVLPTGNQTKTFTMTEVKKHNNKNDCWLVIDGKVYDVTNYIDSHPGGKAMANFCGQEATAAFNTKGQKGKPHKPVAYEVLKNLYIGDLK